jgi:Arc/MetJ-type ribon-helix-helix transcriptional regulator
MSSKSPVSVRLDDETLDKIDDKLDRSKRKGIVPPNASRSDLIRMGVLELVEDVDDEDELEEKVRAYYGQ